MTDRGVLLRRFNALLSWIAAYRHCQSLPNLSPKAVGRYQALIDQDVAEGIRLSERMAALDMKKVAIAVEETGGDSGRRRTGRPANPVGEEGPVAAPWPSTRPIAETFIRLIGSARDRLLHSERP